MIERRGVQALAVVLVGVLVVSGCGSGADAPLTAEEARALPPVTSLMTSSWEFDRSYNQAESRFLQSCMAEKGHKFRAARAEFDPDEVLPFGYERVPAPPRDESDDDSPASLERAVTPEFRLALDGSDKARIKVVGTNGVKVMINGEGCRAESMKRFYGSLENYKRRSESVIVLNDVASNALARVLTSEEHEAAVDAWRDCMKDAGIESFENPRQIMDPSAREEDRAYLSSEVRADVRCKASTGYLSTAYRLLAAAERSLLDATPGVLEEWQAIRDGAVTEIAAYLAGEGA